MIKVSLIHTLSIDNSRSCASLRAGAESNQIKSVGLGHVLVPVHAVLVFMWRLIIVLVLEFIVLSLSLSTSHHPSCV